MVPRGISAGIRGGVDAAILLDSEVFAIVGLRVLCRVWILLHYPLGESIRECGMPRHNVVADTDVAMPVRGALWRWT